MVMKIYPDDYTLREKYAQEHGKHSSRRWQRLVLKYNNDVRSKSRWRFMASGAMPDETKEILLEPILTVFENYLKAYPNGDPGYDSPVIFDMLKAHTASPNNRVIMFTAGLGFSQGTRSFWVDIPDRKRLHVTCRFGGLVYLDMLLETPPAPQIQPNPPAAAPMIEEARQSLNRLKRKCDEIEQEAEEAQRLIVEIEDE
jgi:hypothetical protein